MITFFILILFHTFSKIGMYGLLYICWLIHFNMILVKICNIMENLDMLKEKKFIFIRIWIYVEIVWSRKIKIYIKFCLLFQKGLLLLSAFVLLKRPLQHYFKIFLLKELRSFILRTILVWSLFYAIRVVYTGMYFLSILLEN